MPDYIIEVSVTVRPQVASTLQDQYAICDAAGDWIQDLTMCLQRELLDVSAGSVHVRPAVLNVADDAHLCGTPSLHAAEAPAAGPTMSDDDLTHELARLRHENATLKAQAAKGITMKVSEKGGLPVYGMGRFPVTLYKEPWLTLLNMAADIRAFIAAHDGTLKSKG